MAMPSGASKLNGVPLSAQKPRSTALEELTPTLVSSLIRRIEVHNNDKSSGHCSVKVDIYFTAIGLIDIPTEDEIKSLMEKIQSNPQEYRLTA